jgi:flavin-dependent dehydrogenase
VLCVGRRSNGDEIEKELSCVAAVIVSIAGAGPGGSEAAYGSKRNATKIVGFFEHPTTSLRTGGASLGDRSVESGDAEER